MTDQARLDQLTINTIRTLAMDAVQAANSGHPGTPMALAPVAYSLWQRFLRFDPDDPIWPNRDRFVLSIGHASMLLYSLLHLTGVKAVNPEYETARRAVASRSTTSSTSASSTAAARPPRVPLDLRHRDDDRPAGPGRGHQRRHGHRRALAGRALQPPGFEMFDYDVYALCGDGCMMEGISSEAASLAGHLKLSNLCWIYDNNKITIEGNTDLAFSEDVATRFIGYGWNVTRVGDANDLDMLERAFHDLQEGRRTGPTLIIVDSHIACGAPNKQDTHAAHGEPLGEEEIKLTKRNYGWPEDAKFLVPDGVREHFAARHRHARQGAARRLDGAVRGVQRQVSRAGRPARCACSSRELPDGWDKDLPTFPRRPQGHGRPRRLRQGAQRARQERALADRRLGRPGAVDQDAADLRRRRRLHGATTTAGRNFHFGIREHAMGAILNGLSLSKVRALRLGLPDLQRLRPRRRSAWRAIMEIPVIYIFTHDSIGVGEDGPTHQPIEQLASLRAIPGLITLRPGDANEVVEAWKVIMQLQHEPVALILTPPGRCRRSTARSTRRPRAWPRAPTCWPTRRAASPT